ncbi:MULTISPECIES: hypothetical protein [Marinobacter]|jgi:hypothetical protein|uniref:hypothetical protein n=1 Tax=Marinobacter TaxID=2742 RepID=UPI0020035CA9|nr:MULTISPECIES: hypothetical protein [Marinobacter]MCK7550683.1 hypothetical protein [Marinobacter goseongensis]MDV3504581.1 hypothetical protein [Marinobacter sp. M-5]
MSRIELVRQAVDEHLADPYDLLAVRLMFPPDREAVKIDQEIRDLYVYPERLESGYRDEWRALATRALFRHAFDDHWRSDPDNLNRYLAYLRDQAIPRCIHEHIGLFRTLGEVLAIARADNAVAFPDPTRQALMELIWPEGRRS